MFLTKLVIAHSLFLGLFLVQFCVLITSQTLVYRLFVCRSSLPKHVPRYQRVCNRILTCTESAHHLAEAVEAISVVILATVFTTEVQCRSSCFGTEATVERKVVSNQHSLSAEAVQTFLL